jgi:lactate 2-monooxygenase
MTSVDRSQGNSWQREIYLNGFSGIKPKVSIDPLALEAQARQVMSTEAFAYIAGGAGLESAIAGNRSAFEKYRIIPRVLRDVSDRDTSLELFGTKLQSPILLSPIGVLELTHPQADIAAAKAAAALGLPFIISNQASQPMEAVAHAMGASPRWFQLYWSKSRDLVASFVQRAERCGCKAIVVTLDTTMLGWRTRDLGLAYLPFLEGKGIAQYTSDPVFQKMLDLPGEPREKRQVRWQTLSGLVKMVNAYPGNGFFRKLKSGRPMKAVQKFVSIYSNPALTFDDLPFLRSCTGLPVLLKGVLHPDDAKRAIDAGIDGIIVSNHGGRQVDGSIATLDALPAIAAAVNRRVPVLLDGGVRGGADVFKALALGANAVCIGRPYAYGLAIAGTEGVKEVLMNLIADFDLTMGLSGCRSLTELQRGSLQ